MCSSCWNISHYQRSSVKNTFAFSVRVWIRIETEMMKSQVVEQIAFWLRALSGSGFDLQLRAWIQRRCWKVFSLVALHGSVSKITAKRAVDVFKSIIRALNSSLELTVVKQNQLSPRCERAFVTQSLSIVVQFARLLMDVFWRWLNLFKA